MEEIKNILLSLIKEKEKEYVEYKEAKNNFDFNSSTYTTTSYVNQNNQTDHRTAPTQPMFISRALNAGKADTNTRYTMSVHWTPGSENFSVEVFLLPNGNNWKNAYKSDHGVCFSTLGKKGCQ